MCERMGISKSEEKNIDEEGHNLNRRQSFTIKTHWNWTVYKDVEKIVELTKDTKVDVVKLANLQTKRDN